MDMMRMASDRMNMVCRNCLERKPANQKREAVQEIKPKMEVKINQETKEYFCKECKYSFSRAKHLVISTCPYCGNSGSLMQKGSTAKIIADASKMKERFDW